MGTSLPSLQESAQTEQRRAERLFALVLVVGGIGSSIAGQFDRMGGLLTAWDESVIPVTSALFFLSGLMIYVRPQWLTAAILLSMIPTAIYQQGVMFMAVHHPDAASYYSAASSGPYFPLFYIVVFIALRKGAPTLSWINCAGFYLQFLLNMSVLSEPTPLPGQAEGEHLLVEALTAHPIYIVALNYIVNLRERLNAIQQDAFQQKETFLSMLSHEIRNQLQTMVNAIELLDLRLKEPAERRAVTRLQSSAAQLQTYLSDVNELTKLEDPDLRVEDTDVDVAQLLDDIREQWLPKAESRGLRLEVLAGDQPLVVRTDAARVRQIVSNLVSNAIKYTSAGHVTIAVHPDNGSGVAIEVTDTGIGIDERFLEKIFLPHVRLDNAIDLKAEGSGLGLSIVQRLAHSVGGSVRVESRLNEGSRFVLTLPIRRAQRSPLRA